MGINKRKMHTEFNENLRKSSSSLVRSGEKGGWCSKLVRWEGCNLRREQMVQNGMMGWDVNRWSFFGRGDLFHLGLVSHIVRNICGQRTAGNGQRETDSGELSRHVTVPCGKHPDWMPLIMGVIVASVFEPVCY